MEETNVNKIGVPKDVLDGLEAVRLSGLSNMFDRPVVARLAEEMGYGETAEWIVSNKRLYAEGIFKGFAAQEDA